MTFQFTNTQNLAADVIAMLKNGSTFSELAAYICDKENLHILIENPFRQRIFSYKWTTIDGQAISLENEEQLNTVFSDVFKDGIIEAGELIPGVAYAPISEAGKPEAIIFVKYVFPYTSEQAVFMAANLSSLYLYDRPDAGNSTQRSHFITDRVARDLLLYTVREDLNGSIYLKNIQNSFPKFEPPFTVLTFSADTIQELEQAYSQVSINYPNSFQLYKDNQIYVFLYAVPYGDAKQNVRLGRSLDNFVSYYNLRCGVSQPFEFLENRNWYRRQSKHALLSATKETPICFASDRHLDVILSGVLSRYEHKLFELNAIEIIEEFDNNNQTELLNTLSTYLDHFNHPAQAASALFIDRSTLKYRLQQISTLIQLNLDDTKIAEKLRISIYVHNTYIALKKNKRCSLLSME